MPEYPHFFLKNNASTETFKPAPGRGNKVIPERDRNAHADRLLAKLDLIWSQQREAEVIREAAGLPVRDGTYVSFHSQAGFDLVTKSLEDLGAGIRLLNVKGARVEGDGIVTATVYVPRGKEGHFVRKINEYQDDEKLTKSGKPRNMALVNSVDDVSLTLLEGLWTDDVQRMPGDQQLWCEAWLRIDGANPEDEHEQVRSFDAVLDSEQITRKDGTLFFPERAVVLIFANRDQLVELMVNTAQLAELRSGQEAGFWTSQGVIDQQDWVENLSERISIQAQSDVKVCVLDTGVNNGHPLLAPLLPDTDVQTANPIWGTDDHDPGAGHGTLMAGLAAYGNLEAALASSGNVNVTHRLSSVKVLPRPGQAGTPKELWGDITQQAVFRAEAQSPDALYVFCMAISAQNDSNRGRPSSWSGAIDNLCFGEGENQRLILLSAGNVRDPALWANYPDSNLISSVENPGQSWNAVTVGAFTARTHINDRQYDAYDRLASQNQLSPFSTTSRIWERKWGAKPDIVFEGGNLLRAPDGTIDAHDDLYLLSTSKAVATRPLATINATSAATAQASWFAAKIRHEYPEIWPETIRALLVHSASWTQEMIDQCGATAGNRESYGNLLRMFGYGIPNLDRATKSFENAFTFIAQEVMQPFTVGEAGSAKTNEMHMYSLPWPEQELLDLGDTPVRLRITLSYFIEPGPGEIGWGDKYRYQSHGFRFDVNNVGESHDQFRSRINRAAREEGADGQYGGSGSERWTIGNSNINRATGSVHSDYWEGTAAELATCNAIAVFPVIGWWRARRHLGKVEDEARYTLVVSLETPEVGVELYTAVQNIIATVIEV